ncbi:secreted arylsulphatase [Phycomyces blakesleeanus]|uniref:Arylsulfatase n=2 Tax=Phycomyces blakesleeanus TaxID=4837 RepID=A0A163D6N7_PHYB8|nr:secreted arylsulphatase [Phycomyces blakesleeanus NRRL 1555(-)]OAD69140.1 secreted arylsulphatase [Phycomyces blakesleeanus NRRL 1555(-)]|eukprot:XP_018287180.1 secreted arylsulphatase [Phycomyces blakesleeanus NRRL 1555(-)]
MKFTIIGAALFLLQSFLLTEAKREATPSKPNILFIFTDDQDAKLDSIDYMPNLQKYLVQQGTIYRNHYATISVCCPSRVSLLRGQYAHNTNITDVSPPYGGYARFSRLGLGDNYLPIWMQEAGYSTHYIGKLMNEYTVNNYNNPKPKGFDYQDQLVDPFTYIYNTAVFSRNGEPPVYYNNTYQTDVIHAKARDALKRQRDTDKPFFLWVAPMAPHGQFFIGDNGSIETMPAVPATRHANLFKDVKIPRNPNFNPENQTKTASFWKDMERLNDTIVEELDEAYRDRLRALQAVDEMIGSLFEELEEQGKLDNTYVIYSADNGYHLGQHRSYPGKCSNIEEDINVPFIVRGPGIEKGKISDVVSSHHDIAPTLLALAKGDEYVPDWVDGGVIPLTKDLERHPKPVAKESFAVEFWATFNMAENYPSIKIVGPNTYKTVRVISDNYNYMYSVWCTGEHELYNLKDDPYELNNIYGNTHIQLRSRLDALIIVLKACRADNCRDPWRIIHPEDPSIKTLEDALHEKYDYHYTQFQKFTFGECENHYSASNELPHIGSHFINNITYIHTNSGSQAVFSAPRNQKRDETKPDLKSIPEDILGLLYLIPKPEQAGQFSLDEDYEKHSVPVPQELIDTHINWSEYGFYNVGS